MTETPKQERTQAAGAAFDCNDLLAVWPQPTEEEIYLHSLAKEYHERTEAYDRTVCTGPILDGAIIPVTRDERRSVMRNAMKVRDELVRRARERFIGRNKVAQAINRYDR